MSAFSAVIIADFDYASIDVQTAIYEIIANKRAFYEGVDYVAPENLMVVGIISAANFASRSFQIIPKLLQTFFVSKTLSTKPTFFSLDTTTPPSFITRVDLEDARGEFSHIYISVEMEQYIRDLLVAVRTHPVLANGITPRLTKDFWLAAKGQAFLEGSEFVTPNHAVSISESLLSHKMVFRSELPMATDSLRAKTLQITPEEIVQFAISQISPPV
jgi:MoxR-like ATPase